MITGKFITHCQSLAEDTQDLKVLVTVSGAMVITSMALLYTLYFFSFLGSVSLSLFNFAAAIIYSLTLLFSWKGFHRVASLWILGVFIIHMFLLSKYVFSTSTGFHYFLLTVPTSVFLFFTERERYEKIFFTAIATIIFFYFENSGNSSPYVTLKHHEEKLLFATVILTVIADIFFVMSISLKSISNREKKLEDLATKDALTELNNRRTFMAVGEKLIEQSKRYNKDLSLLLFDIDDFKRINDKYGHLVGDEIIKQVARTLRGKLRASDCLSRFGGDEFVVLLPETDLLAAHELAVSLGNSIRISELTIDNVEKIHCTVSVGVSKSSSSTSTLLQLLNQADIALYQAKNEGRNRSIIYTGDNTNSYA